ncbi:MAG: molybdopterin-dependent oxidoreductase [Peptococcaceae bacterium]|nr:molybdopterin-dependent oxidoreductase [Peptococcaceae bacterium]
MDLVPILSLWLNGEERSVTVDRELSLLDVLRNYFGLTGAKKGCGRGLCGACAVLLDGRVTMSCRLPVGQAAGRSVTTIEGIGTPDRPHPVQTAFVLAGAVQCGYCTPGMVIRTKSLLDQNPHPTREEIVRAFSPHLCRCTGYAKIFDAVAMAAAVRRGESSFPSPWPGEGAPVVGARIPRRDALAKATGTELFAADVTPGGTLHLKVLRSPYAHALIEGIETGEAAARPGVAAVFTAADIAGTNRLKISRADTPILCDGKVRYAGDPVAVVAADTEKAASDALAYVRIKYKRLQEVFDPEEALEDGAPQIHHDCPNLLARLNVRHGDAASALAVAGVVVGGEFTTPYVEHAYLEPDAGTACLDDDNRLVIRAGSQNIHHDRKSLAEALGLPLERVRVVQTPTGGAFGGKLDISVQGVLGLAALKLGRPVKLVYTREETHLCTTKRHPFKMRCRMGADKHGRLTGLAMDIIANTGAYASFGRSVMSRALAHVTGPYRIPNVQATGLVVFTNGPVGGAMRGFGVPQVVFAVESLLDMLAAKLNLDPLEIRRVNALRPGDTTAAGQILDQTGLIQCLDRLQPYYDAAAKWAEYGDAVKRGVGLACMWFGPGKSHPDQSEAHIELTGDGGVRLYIGAADIGQGSDTVFAQLAAQELGLPFPAVDVVTTDTSVTPDGGYSSGSRQTYISGGAVKACAAELRRALLAAAAVILKVDAGGLECRGGAVRPRGTDGPGIGFKELYAHGQAGRRFAGRREGRISNPDPETGAGIPYETYSFGVQMAEVEVNTSSGETRVNRIVAVHDSGVAVNPLSFEGQIEGGVVMGLGYALTERFIPGQSHNFNGYRLPRAKDVPEIIPIAVEVPRPGGPFGAAAIGECGLVPTVPAVTNAIARACGVRVYDLPAAGEQIRRELTGKR